MQIEHLNKETTDGTMRNLDALYQLFPSCFTEAQDVITGKMHRAGRRASSSTSSTVNIHTAAY